MSGDLFSTEANINVCSDQLPVRKKHDCGDLFKSVWNFKNSVEPASQPKLSKDSMFITGLHKYDPDQPRDEDGRWADAGGGGGGLPNVDSIVSAARAVKADDPKSAEHFLQSTRDFVDAVKEGKIKPTPSMWDRMLEGGGKVLERVAEGIEILAISAGAGAAIGTFAARGISRAAGFRVGTAVAATLAVALIYKEWASKQSAMRLKHESARLRDNVRELEGALAHFKGIQDD